MRHRVLASVLVALGLLAGPVWAPTPASSQVHVDIRIGTSISGGRRISCWEGQRSLERRRFRNVRAHNCSGRVFVYSGRRDSRDWWIDLSSRDGRIVRMQRRR